MLTLHAGWNAWCCTTTGDPTDHALPVSDSRGDSGATTYEQLPPSSVSTSPGHVSPPSSIWPLHRQLSAPLASRCANQPTSTYTGVLPLLSVLLRRRRSLHHRLRHSGFLASRRPLSILAAASEAWFAAPSTILAAVSHTHKLNNGARAVPVAPAAAAQVHGDKGELDQGHAEAGGSDMVQALLHGRGADIQ